MSETVGVTYQVIHIEPVHGAGDLLALATIELDVASVTLTLQGVQIRRGPHGALECSAPMCLGLCHEHRAVHHAGGSSCCLRRGPKAAGSNGR